MLRAVSHEPQPQPQRGSEIVVSAARYFPLRAAGFSSNPFRALTDAAWADVAVLSAAISDLFDQTAAHLQLLGPLGAGKTTSLLGLQRRAQDHGLRTGYAYLAEGQHALTNEAGDVATLDLFLLDEAQRLAGRSWRRLLAKIAEPPGRDPSRQQPVRLVFSAHANQSARFAAAGLPLATVELGALSLPEYRAILDRRIATAALPGQPHATLTDDAIAYLQATFGPNRRAAEWLLYEVFQRLRAPEVVSSAHLQALHDEPPPGRHDQPAPGR